jgi:clan AA aspartic protease
MGMIHLDASISVPGTREPTYRSAFLVDTRATDWMAPASALKGVGIKPVGRPSYEMADGSRVECDFGLAQIEFMNEITAGRVIFGPEGVEPILGVTALESVGVVVDPANQRIRRLPAIPLKRAWRGRFQWPLAQPSSHPTRCSRTGRAIDG